MLETPDILQRACDTYGGLKGEPKVVFKEIHPPETIELAPTTERFKPYYRLPVPKNPCSREATLNDLETVQFTYQTARAQRWGYKIWISIGTSFDKKTNTLTLTGYYRIYHSECWIKDEVQS